MLNYYFVMLLIFGLTTTSFIVYWNIIYSYFERIKWSINLKDDGRICSDSMFKYKRLAVLNNFCSKYLVTPLPFVRIPDKTFDHLANVVLIVVFNRPHHYNIPMLQLLYSSWFKRVIYCSTFPQDPYKIQRLPFLPYFDENDSNFLFINLTEGEIHSGYFSYQCAIKAISIHDKDDDSFLIIADDMLLNFWNNFDINSLNFYSGCRNIDTDNGPGSVWWKSEYGAKALSRIKGNETVIKNRLANSLIQSELNLLFDTLFEPVWCPSDVYYLPKQSTAKFRQLGEVFVKENVFLEIAVPKILGALGWKNDTDQLSLKGTYLWSMEDRADPFKQFDSRNLFLHPLKFSRFGESDIRSKLCTKYIGKMFNAF